jgi:hypothetical protein
MIGHSTKCGENGAGTRGSENTQSEREAAMQSLIQVYIPEEARQAIFLMAQTSQMQVSQYIQALLINHVRAEQAAGRIPPPIPKPVDPYARPSSSAPQTPNPAAQTPNPAAQTPNPAAAPVPDLASLRKRRALGARLGGGRLRTWRKP